MVEFCDLLGTPYAPVSKIPPVKGPTKYIPFCSPVCKRHVQSTCEMRLKLARNQFFGQIHMTTFNKDYVRL